MPILRLAYATQLMIALIAVFVLWAQIGGQSHLDLMPWYLKLGLGGGAAIAAVRATMCAVSGATAWNGGSLKWVGILIALLIGCGLSSYYFHMYGESEDEQDEETVTSQLFGAARSAERSNSVPVLRG
jgi:hypothetical protein